MQKEIRERNIEFLKERSVFNWKCSTSEGFKYITSILYELRKNLTLDGIYPHQLAISLQKDRLKEVKEVDYIKIKNLLNYLDMQIEAMQEKLESEKEKLKKSKEPVENEYTRLQKAEKQLNKAEEELEATKSLLTDAKALYSRMHNIALVHKSATLAQIAVHKHEQIWVTEADSQELFEFNKQMNNLFYIDGVFEEKDSQGFITKLPYYFYTKYDADEQKSIITFCEMVIYYMMESSEKVEAVYGNTDILDVLKMNGL